MGLVDIIISGAPRDQIVSNIERYTRFQDPKKLLAELPLRQHQLKAKIHAAILENSLEGVLFRTVTRITAIEEITWGGTEQLPRYPDLLGLGTILSGESRDQTELRAYLRGEFAASIGLPELTNEHQKFVDNLSVDYIGNLSSEELATVLPIADGLQFSLKETANTYSLYLHRVHDKVVHDRELQYTILKTLTGISSAHELKQRKSEVKGYTQLGGLVTLFTGKSEKGAKIREYLLSLLEEFAEEDQFIRRLREESWDFINNETTTKAYLLENIPVFGKDAHSINQESGKYSPRLRKIHGLVIHDRGVQFYLLKRGWCQLLILTTRELFCISKKIPANYLN